MSLEEYVFPGVSQAVLKRKLSTLGDWIVLNSNGERRIVDLDKYKIMNQVQLHTRDLRILDPLLMYPSTILGREKAIILNLEHIKAIITAKEVFLRDPLDDNVIPIVEELRRRFTSINSSSQGKYMNVPSNGENDAEIDFCIAENPFEFRALEVALEAICSFLDARTTELETGAYPALHELTLKISARKLDRVRKLKSSMTRLTARVQKIRDELESLLDDDNDMAELYLSRKLAVASSMRGSGVGIETEISRAKCTSVATNPGSKNDVEELEMLLEAYYMQIDGTMNKLTTLREYIHDTEAYINIQLDNHRNQLIEAEFILSSIALCLTVYSVVVGMFGTNLKYTWNNNYDYMFKWVIIVTTAVCGLLHICIVYYAEYRHLAGS